MKAALGRAKLKVDQARGAADKTVDDEFEEQRAAFVAAQKRVKEVRGSLAKHGNALLASQATLKSVATASESRAAVAVYGDVATAHVAFDAQHKAAIGDMDTFITKLERIAGAVTQRDRRVAEYDKARYELEKAEGKDDVAGDVLQRLRADVERTRAAYDEGNAKVKAVLRQTHRPGCPGTGSMKAALGRAKLKVDQARGAADKTVDDEFEEQRAAFVAAQKRVKEVRGALAKHGNALLASQATLKSVTTTSEVRAAVAVYGAAATAHATFDAAHKAALDDVDTFIAKLERIAGAVAQRDRRVAEYDKARYELEKARAKDDVATDVLQRLRADVERTRSTYDDGNVKVKAVMQQAAAQHTGVVDAAVAAHLAAQHRLYVDLGTAFA
eukprot:CAMPEP_0198366342 /NCGR_PEP_ID=MMETSP1450-20131203/154632_1 /TAXON_ID=753684 ORGANISM="Madagascaria erythrocladiodes, Strain CCMP3234" /NCGR_SAMPLE_ID=MMETSP1450 /ASSEMBLY_ACC=CAM_ASM_001115 /LENGTH=385 /DNA_ID=CAMNT_0044073807 /DNA_START=39 /DNA_END=1193 /DNA_ORIENTATION=+